MSKHIPLMPLKLGLFAVVDDDDFAYLSQWKWFAKRQRHGNFYAIRRLRWTMNGRKTERQIFMHRDIAGVSRFQVDHVNRDGLNNTRGNLRLATRSQQRMNAVSRNKYGFKGVSFNGCTFQAKIRLNKQRYHLGNFSTPQLAALAYDKAAQSMFGDRALTNY